MVNASGDTPHDTPDAATPGDAHDGPPEHTPDQPASEASRPNYLVIAADLEVLAGQLRPGDRLPSQSVLKERYGVSHVTVAKAYDVLIKKGLVVSRPYVGYFVRGHSTMRWHRTRSIDADATAALPRNGDAQPADTWAHDAAGAGFSHRQEITVEIINGAEQIGPDNTLAELLGVPDNTTIVARRRIRYVGPAGQPAATPDSLATSYYPLDLVRGTPLLTRESVNTVAVLLEQGLDFAHTVDVLYPRIATTEEAGLLELPDVTAVIEQIRVVATSDGRKFLVQRIISASPQVYEFGRTT